MDIVDRLQNKKRNTTDEEDDALTEIQTLRAKVEVLEEALYKLRTYNDEYLKNGRVDSIVCNALSTCDKQSVDGILEKSLTLVKTQLNNYMKLSEVKHDTNK